jgi:multisubunit Na+/H+ antiporter MnhG subunit
MICFFVIVVVYEKYKLASAFLLLTNPFNTFPFARVHFSNSARIVLSLGSAFTFFNKVEVFRFPTPQL